MDPNEYEYIQLLERYKKAEEYERTKFKNDTLENQERAIQSLVKIIKRMGELWELMTEEQRQKYRDQL
jgi:DNA polymerase II large subunit